MDIELAKLAHDAWRTPGRIGSPHVLDEFPNFLGDRRSTGSATLTEPPPVISEALFLPGDHGMGLGEGERLFPAGPESRQPEAHKSRSEGWMCGRLMLC